MAEYECELRTYGSGIRLDQNWMLIHRGEEGDGGSGMGGGVSSNFRLFADAINE